MPVKSTRAKFSILWKCAFASLMLAALFFSIQTASAFSDGADAIDLLGHYVQNDGVTPDYTENAVDDAPNPYGIQSVSYGNAIDFVNHRLFIPDASNNRVMVFNLDSSNRLIDRIADNVIGQDDLYTNAGARVTQSGITAPTAVAVDLVGQRLFVAQPSGNRVTVYDIATITNGEPAVNVLGQANFTASVSTTSQAGLNSPSGLAYDEVNRRLFVSQSGANRVSIFDVASITDGEAAANVLGQATFTGGATSNASTGMNNPQGLAFDNVGQRLFVVQVSNNRVTVYDVATSTITNGKAASYILGQSSFAGTSNVTSRTGMDFPSGVAFDSSTNRIFVSQSNGFRVTSYDVATSTIANGSNALNVLGQTNFTNRLTLSGQAGMLTAYGLVADPGNQLLYVLQGNLARVGVYDIATSTITDGANAVDLIGHTLLNDGVTPDYTESAANDTPGPYGMAGGAYGDIVDTVNHRLFVGEASNHRVLVFNLNSSNVLVDRTPDYVLGQSTFYTAVSTTTQAGMNFPTGMAYDSANQRLFVAQLGSHRVSVYDVNSITNGEPAINELGQTDFVSSTATTTQAGMNGPYGLAYDSANQKLYVAQSSSRRVTVYDVASITDGEAAINVLGQGTFTAAASATSQAGMNDPRGLALDEQGQRLFVSEVGNNRVNVFDVNSITNGEAAVNVLGQTSFGSSTAASTTQASINAPRGMAYDSYNKRLFVSQVGNHRVTVFDVASIINGENAVSVLGQANFASTSSQRTRSGMNTPIGFAYNPQNQQLWVSESNNNRMTLFSVAPLSIELSSTTASSTDESVANNFPVLLVRGTNNGTSTVELDITGGTATGGGADYSSNDPIVITIPPGTYDGSTSTAIAITAPSLVQDSIVETGGETIQFSLANAYNAIVEDADGDVVTRSSLAYTIADDDVAPNLPTPSPSSTTQSAIVPGSQTAISGYTPLPGFGLPLSNPVINSGAQHVSAPGITGGSGSVFYRNLSTNMKGPDVIALQGFLNTLGFAVAKTGPGSPGNETNLFGPATRAAVQRFQLKYGIVSTSRDSGYGIFGPKTRAMANLLFKK